MVSQGLWDPAGLSWQCSLGRTKDGGKAVRHGGEKSGEVHFILLNTEPPENSQTDSPA